MMKNVKAMRLSGGPQKQRDGPAPVVYATETLWLYVGRRENRNGMQMAQGVRQGTGSVDECGIAMAQPTSQSKTARTFGERGL